MRDYKIVFWWEESRDGFEGAKDTDKSSPPPRRRATSYGFI
jgi:hypothetical protein